jgi:PKD repeat protein
MSHVLFVEVEAQAEVEILTHSGYITPLGMYRVVGEAKNLGSRFLGPVDLNFTFYDANNSIIPTLTKNGTTVLDVLSPNRTSPFSCYVTTQVEMIRSYSVSVIGYTTATAKPYDLNIVAHSYDNTSIYGVIENRGYVNASNTIVFATFYDENKNVVDESATEPGSIDDIGRAYTTVFHISHFVLPHIFERARWYSLTAECEQYALMEEAGLTRFLPPPFAAFVCTPSTNVTLGEIVTFNATGSHASENRTVASFNWKFGDNSTGLGIVTTHTYDTIGNFTVELTVKDNEGLETLAIQIVRVTEATNENGDPNMVFYVFGAVVATSAAILFIAVFIAKKRQTQKRRHVKKTGKTG